LDWFGVYGHNGRFHPKESVIMIVDQNNPELLAYLRRTFPLEGCSVPGIGPGRWDSSKLADAQEKHAANRYNVYTLYTEAVPDLDLKDYIGRYFDGYTVTSAIGVYQGQTEPTTVITIVAPLSDMQKVMDLAGDIRVAGKQQSVLVTWGTVTRFDITEASVRG